MTEADTSHLYLWLMDWHGAFALAFSLAAIYAARLWRRWRRRSQCAT